MEQVGIFLFIFYGLYNSSLTINLDGLLIFVGRAPTCGISIVNY